MHREIGDYDELANLMEYLKEFKEELRKIKEGEVIVMPVSQNHADAMINVGMAFGKTFSNGEWK